MLYYIISYGGKLAAARRSLALCALLWAGALGTGPAAAAPDVVASIKPLHALVAGVMERVGAPHLLIRGAGSPHGTTLRPSDARALAGAALVFWIGPELETSLAAPLAALAAPDRVVALSRAPGIGLLARRAGGLWEAPDAGHDAGHAIDPAGDPAAWHPGFAAPDPHIWLDPANGTAMVRAIEAALSRADPANAPRYRANAAGVIAALEALDAEIAAALAPVAGLPYVVFHDAYRYFEARYGLNPVGALTVNPERSPGARRVREIRGEIRARSARCVFAEPQFRPALVATLIEGTAARGGILDPLGAELAPGPGAYAGLLRALAASLVDCLAPAPEAAP